MKNNVLGFKSIVSNARITQKEYDIAAVKADLLAVLVKHDLIDLSLLPKNGDPLDHIHSIFLSDYTKIPGFDNEIETKQSVRVDYNSHEGNSGYLETSVMEKGAEYYSIRLPMQFDDDDYVDDVIDELYTITAIVSSSFQPPAPNDEDRYTSIAYREGKVYSDLFVGSISMDVPVLTLLVDNNTFPLVASTAKGSTLKAVK